MRITILLAVLALTAGQLLGLGPAAAPAAQADAFIGGAGLGPKAMLGDVDKNGEVDSIDALLILQFDAGIIYPPPYPEEYYQRADANQDGFVSVLDVSLILQFHAGLIDRL